MSDKRREKTRPDGVSVPLRMPAELDQKIEAAAEQVKLSKADTMRLALDRGLDVLIAQLTTPPATTAAA